MIDGWFCGYTGWIGRQNFGDRPELLAALEVNFEDGSSLFLGTDDSWKTTVGPILESDFLMGEIYDARRELGGWSLPGYDDSAWSSVLTKPPRKIILELRQQGHFPVLIPFSTLRRQKHSIYLWEKQPSAREPAAVTAFMEAIQLGCAITGRCGLFLTNDSRLSCVSGTAGLKIQLLSEWAGISASS